jgi:hypothetical protein
MKSLEPLLLLPFAHLFLKGGLLREQLLEWLIVGERVRYYRLDPWSWYLGHPSLECPAGRLLAKW